MRGVITGRDVLSNLGLIWREFGALCVWRCFWACLSGQRTTFLDLAVKPVDHGHGHHRQHVES